MFNHVMEKTKCLMNEPRKAQWLPWKIRHLAEHLSGCLEANFLDLMHFPTHKTLF